MSWPYPVTYIPGERGRQTIKRVFKEMVELAEQRNGWLVNSNEEMLLQRLSGLGKENMKKLQESEIRLYEQICSLQLVITGLERKCGETPTALLKVRV